MYNGNKNQMLRQFHTVKKNNKERGKYILYYFFCLSTFNNHLKKSLLLFEIN